MMTVFKRTSITLLLFLLAAQTMAQPDEAIPPTPEGVEQIDVIGQRTILSLRAETQLLERDMYRLFNELNSNDDFDVACGEKTPTGSKLPVWQCEAAYMREAEGLELAHMWDNRGRARGVMQFGYVPNTREQLNFLHRKKATQLNDEMKMLALEHPELASAMLKLHDRRQRLDEMERKLKE